MVIHVSPLEGRADLGAEERVTIGLRDGIETRMEIRMRFAYIKNADRGRQQPVDRAPQVIHGNGVVNGKRGYLHERMHSGIGAARSGNMNGAALDAGHDLLERPLNGAQTGLHLPAMKVGAVIGKRDADAPRQFRPVSSPVSVPADPRGKEGIVRGRMK